MTIVTAVALQEILTMMIEIAEVVVAVDVVAATVTTTVYLRLPIAVTVVVAEVIDLVPDLENATVMRVEIETDLITGVTPAGGPLQDRLHQEEEIITNLFVIHTKVTPVVLQPVSRCCIRPILQFQIFSSFLTWLCPLPRLLETYSSNNLLLCKLYQPCGDSSRKHSFLLRILQQYNHNLHQRWSSIIMLWLLLDLTIYYMVRINQV